MTSVITTDAQLVQEYFKRLTEDTTSTLYLFADDATVYEPFSTEHGLKGKEQIAYFLSVARMANKGLAKKISILSRGKNRIEAVVQFTRGDTVDGRFHFKTTDVRTANGTEKKIKELRIQFVN